MKVLSQSIRYETSTGDILYVICQEDLIHFETWSSGYKNCIDVSTETRISSKSLEEITTNLQLSGIDFVELENFIHYSGFIRDGY